MNEEFNKKISNISLEQDLPLLTEKGSDCATYIVDLNSQDYVIANEFLSAVYFYSLNNLATKTSVIIIADLLSTSIIAYCKHICETVLGNLFYRENFLDKNSTLSDKVSETIEFLADNHFSARAGLNEDKYQLYLSRFKNIADTVSEINTNTKIDEKRIVFNAKNLNQLIVYLGQVYERLDEELNAWNASVKTTEFAR